MKGNVYGEILNFFRQKKNTAEFKHVVKTLRLTHVVEAQKSANTPEY